MWQPPDDPVALAVQAATKILHDLDWDLERAVHEMDAHRAFPDRGGDAQRSHDVPQSAALRAEPLDAFLGDAGDGRAAPSGGGFVGYTTDQLNDIFDRTSGYCHLCFAQLAFANYGRRGARGAWEVEHSNPRAWLGYRIEPDPQRR